MTGVGSADELAQEPAPAGQEFLTRDRVEAVVQEATSLTRVDGPYLKVLRWLVWLPLLSSRELACIMGKDEKTVWHYFTQLGRYQLTGRVVISEPGWPRHQRFYLTDLGLYVLVACHPSHLSAARLAACYAIERSDLLARLARPQVHLVLCDLVSQLLSACPEGYQLTSYQQPWREQYYWQRSRHTFSADAALLLRDPTGCEHAFYVLVDQPERLFHQPQEQDYLEKLSGLRNATIMQREQLPRLLLLTKPGRFPYWASLLEQDAFSRSSSLIAGALADYGSLHQGTGAPIWLPFEHLVTSAASLPEKTPGPSRTSLLKMLDQPASPRLIERLSQRRALAQLFAQGDTPQGTRGRKRLPLYIGEPLLQDLSELQQDVLTNQDHAIVQLRRSLHSEKQDRMRIASLLNLLLNAPQKALLALLARHPALSLADLLFHLQGEQCESATAVQQHLGLLRDLALLYSFSWKEDVPAYVSWRERERFGMTELGLRYLSMRHGVTPAHYLMPLPPDDQTGTKLDRRTISPLDPSFKWVQPGLGELMRQLPHTNGLYRCIRHIMAVGKRSARYEIVVWKSAREAIRSCFDPLAQKKVFAKPDAELLYQQAGSEGLASVLIEYDRGTTYTREYRRKFLAYSAYQRLHRSLLPPIVMITPDMRSVERIRRNIVQAGIQELLISVVLEQEVLRNGLLPALQLP